MKSTVRLAYSMFFLAGVALLITMPGCSGGGEPTAKVSGKVTHDGQPVTSGSITFAPTSGTVGKPGSSEVKSDGSYVLSSYAQGDGAVIGRHKVIYSPGSTETVEETPLAEGEHAEDSTEPIPFSGLVPKEVEVEVKAGSNEINIELVAGSDTGGTAEPTTEPEATTPPASE